MTETESGKRKASTAGLSIANRSVKRRASKACCCCRSRKVRCDVVENGSPCTNCRLDRVKCIVIESKRRKFVRHVKTNIEYVYASRANNMTDSNRKSRAEMQSNQPWESLDEVSDENPAHSNFQGSSDRVPTSPPQTSVGVDHNPHMPHLLRS